MEQNNVVFFTKKRNDCPGSIEELDGVQFAIFQLREYEFTKGKILFFGTAGHFGSLLSHTHL
jgi:hypothetical protein